METKKRGFEKQDQKQIVHRKSIDTFGQRTSQYRGVTRLVFLLISSTSFFIPIPCSFCSTFFESTIFLYYLFCLYYSIFFASFVYLIFLFNILVPSGIDGLVDMKLIFGTTFVRKRGKAGKEGKVSKEKQNPST